MFDISYYFLAIISNKTLEDKKDFFFGSVKGGEKCPFVDWIAERKKLDDMSKGLNEVWIYYSILFFFVWNFSTKTKERVLFWSNDLNGWIQRDGPMSILISKFILIQKNFLSCK